MNRERLRALAERGFPSVVAAAEVDVSELAAAMLEVDARLLEIEKRMTPPDAPWVLHRFRVPLGCSAPALVMCGPFWIEGETSVSALGGWTIMRAYLPADRSLIEFWPESHLIESERVESIEFTDEFPKPEWWNG